MEAEPAGCSLSSAARARMARCDECLQAVHAGDRWHLHLSSPGVDADSREFSLSVIGRFNLANTLAVAGTWRSLGWSLAEITTQMRALKPVPGRMEMIRLDDDQVANDTSLPMVVVDYAHTPDALSNVLQALRQIADSRGGKLWCVFGAGGNRDRGKRPVMAAAVEALADQVVVTSDNPRHEDPQQILADVCAGLSRPAWRADVDRRAAIEATVQAAAAADVVLVAGKGRESTQEIAGVFHPFSDAEVVAQALRSWQAGAPCQKEVSHV